MSMKFAASVMLALSVSAFSLEADAKSSVIKGAYVGCVTEAALDEFLTAANRKDMRHINSLLGSVCVTLEGREYSLVRAGFLTASIRVYAGSGSVVLYTVRKALSK